MTEVFICQSDKKSEHKIGVQLALYAVKRVFGADCEILYRAGGKPFVNTDGIFVSISHTDGLCAAAVSDAEIGIDIEIIPSDADSPERTGRLNRLAERYFSPDEVKYVESCAASGFYRVWTAKESFIKFTGEGFSRPLREFSVLNSAYAYSYFTVNDVQGCVCSAAEIKFRPIFVGFDEISSKVQ